VVVSISVPVGIGLRYILIPPKEESPDFQGSTIITQRGDITKIVSATGFLSSRGSVELKFNKSGKIKEIMVEEGDYVKEGEILARLEDDQERLALLQAENALKEALLELESAKIGRFPPSDIEKKERKVKEKQLELQLKRKELEDTVLKAPFSGTVSKIYVEKGELVSGETVSASRAILRLIDTSKLFADVTVDEVDISQVKLGQQVKITVDAYPDEIFSGKVIYIAPEATTTSGLVVIEVKIELQKVDPKLKPGFTASADIIVGEAKNVVFLPVEAVRERGGRYFVLVLKEEKPSPQMVEVGISDGTYVEIKKGLKEGEVVLSSGLTPIIEMRRAQKETEERRPPGLPGGVRRLVP
jgi:HlyD family secretion protein